jgi:hypothetical protein
MLPYSPYLEDFFGFASSAANTGAAMAKTEAAAATMTARLSTTALSSPLATAWHRTTGATFITLVVLVAVERVVTRAPTTEDATDAAMQEDAGNIMEAIIYFPETVQKICDGGEQRGGKSSQWVFANAQEMQHTRKKK